MIVTSQQSQSMHTLARNGRSPYSRVLRGLHLSDALGLLVRRLARSSGLNHHDGQGKSFVARRCVLSSRLCTPRNFFCLALGNRPRAQPFSTEFTASTKKEKRSKKERKATTAAAKYSVRTTVLWIPIRTWNLSTSWTKTSICAGTLPKWR